MLAGPAERVRPSGRARSRVSVPAVVDPDQLRDANAKFGAASSVADSAGTNAGAALVGAAGPAAPSLIGCGSGSLVRRLAQLDYRTTGIDCSPSAVALAADQDTAEFGEAFGADVSLADMDGDGHADLAVGVPGEDIGAVADAGEGADPARFSRGADRRRREVLRPELGGRARHSGEERRWGGQVRLVEHGYRRPLRAAGCGTRREHRRRGGLVACRLHDRDGEYRIVVLRRRLARRFRNRRALRCVNRRVKGRRE
ncbi:methyltransferase domain-containing protein [Streptomyces sp. NPDC005791]|uniref:methyltransferase domain-containing protein n=1 Tax=Streptomyces sp. NPDC005791 TaxID=3364732 RepID=UPI0036816123